MRIGVMVGPERGDSARKVTRMLADIDWAESAGLDSAWIPQIPNDFDALVAVALMGTRTTRIELGTAVVPLQAQHPIALARQALSVHAATKGRLVLGVGPSHHWIVDDMLGIPYQRPAGYTRDYLEVLDAAFANPGPVDVENDSFRVHNPLDLAPVARQADRRRPVSHLGLAVHQGTDPVGRRARALDPRVDVRQLSDRVGDPRQGGVEVKQILDRHPLRRQLELDQPEVEEDRPLEHEVRACQ